jgi:hypothetical protein
MHLLHISYLLLCTLRIELSRNMVGSSVNSPVWFMYREVLKHHLAAAMRDCFQVFGVMK